MLRGRGRRMNAQRHFASQSGLAMPPMKHKRPVARRSPPLRRVAFPEADAESHRTFECELCAVGTVELLTLLRTGSRSWMSFGKTDTPCSC